MGKNQGLSFIVGLCTVAAGLCTVAAGLRTVAAGLRTVAAGLLIVAAGLTHCRPGQIERMNTAPRDRGGGDPSLLHDAQPESRFCLAKEAGYFRPVAVLYVWFSEPADFNRVRVMTSGWSTEATVDCNLQNSAPDFVKATPATQIEPSLSDTTESNPSWQVFPLSQGCQGARRAALKLRVPEQLVSERICLYEVDFGRKSWGFTFWMN